MGRRTERAAQAAAEQASEAARVLQKRGQEAKEAKSVQSPETVDPAPDSEFTGGHYVKGRNPYREGAMEEIEKDRERRAGVVEEKSEGKPEDTEEKKEEVVEAKDEPKEETQEPAAETKEEPQEGVKEEPKDELVLVKVDGESFRVPKSEVDEAGGVAAYQKIRAADKRLERAKQIERELRETQQKQQQALEQQVTQRQATQQQQIIAAAQQRYQQLLEVIRYGEPQQAFAAQIEINQLVNGLQQMQNQGQMSSEDKAVVRTRMLQARDSFNREFPEIVGDPELLDIVANWENKDLQKMNPQSLLYNDWENFYRGLGNRLRAKMGGAKPATQTAQTTGNTTQPSEKEARKASIVNLPSSSARAAAPKEEKPETREDILNGWRKARGIPTG